MKKRIFTGILLLLVLLIINSCNDQKNKYTYKWPLIGEPFDSLMNRLEWQYLEYASIDSLEKTISLLDSVATHHYGKKDKIATSRVLYWKALYLRRLRLLDSAYHTINRALLLNDSVNYYYDRLRMLSALNYWSDSIDGMQQYRHHEEVMNYTQKIGDKAYEADNANDLGILLGGIGEYEKALYYHAYADSLHSVCGFRKWPIKNRINVAVILKEMGKQKQADSLVMTLSGHPALIGDTVVMNLVPRNLWASTNDKRYLLQAYNQIKDHPKYRYIRGAYRAFLARQNYNEGNYDSTLYYSDLALEDLPYVKEDLHKAEIWFNVSLAWLLRNQLDSALICRIRYEEYLDSARNKQRATEVLRLSALHEMGVKEAEYTASIYRRNMIIVIVVIVVIAAGIVTALLINRRNMRQKMEAIKKELELEKAKRKLTATTLSIEEKDNMLTAIRSELTEMRQEGEIKEGSARKLESTIKSHLAESNNDETFRDMFDMVNPKFTERLRERCPDLAESYVKLACYMLMELDSKRIASLMMIKPESVRQARWRLSQKLNVPENETLESFLRHLNNLI